MIGNRQITFRPATATFGFDGFCQGQGEKD
jgi:hypothetical protein